MVAIEDESLLKRRLYLLAFIDEFGPLYAVYTLWFNDNGITTAQVSAAFLLWAVVALALEIPSGVLADVVDRRHLLAAAFAIRAAAISIWLLAPSLTGVLVGAALWAVHDSAASGAWEALIHDELAAVGSADRYVTVMARVGQFSHLGVAAGTILGAVLLHVDAALTTLGWVTVAAHVGSIALVATLPDVRSRRSPRSTRPHLDSPNRAIGAGPVAEQILDDVGQGASTLRSWGSTLRDGLHEARRNPTVGRLLIVGALLQGLFILDEYLPLLSRARGGDDAVAPIILLVVWIGLLVGGEVAARAPSVTARALGATLIGGVAVTTAAFVLDPVWALMLIAVGYGTLETSVVVADARLQERTPDATRATVTSVVGFGSAAVSIAAFAVIGAMANGDDPTPGHYVVLAALGVGGLLMWAWLPDRRKADG